MALNFILAQQIIFVSGLINVISLLFVFFSCRCLMGKRITKFLWKSDIYKKIYKYHGFFWWIFFISVSFHSILALIVYGVPKF